MSQQLAPHQNPLQPAATNNLHRSTRTMPAFTKHLQGHRMPAQATPSPSTLDPDPQTPNPKPWTGQAQAAARTLPLAPAPRSHSEPSLRVQMAMAEGSVISQSHQGTENRSAAGLLALVCRPENRVSRPRGSPSSSGAELGSCSCTAGRRASGLGVPVGARRLGGGAGPEQGAMQSRDGQVSAPSGDTELGSCSEQQIQAGGHADRHSSRIPARGG